MAEPSEDARRPRVLLAEDAQSLGFLFTDALIRAGLDVKWVRDAEAALAAFEESPPDLLVLDDRMRGAGAAEILETLTEGGGLEPPVLVMSVRPKRVAVQFMELGARECLTKPFPVRALVTRCRHLLSGGITDIDGDTAPFVVVADELEDEPSRRTPHPVLAVVGGALQRALEGLLGTEGARPDPGSAQDVATVAADLAREVLADDRVREVLPTADAVLEGDLRGVSMVQVVQLLAAEQQSGVLDVGSGGDRALFVLSDGRLDLGALPPGQETDLLARVLAHGGVCDLSTARKRVARLDPTLSVVPQALDAGLVGMQDLRRAVGETTRRALFDVLRWREGRFSFGPADRLPSLATDVGLSLSLDELLMEGSRDIEDWHVIEKRLPDPSAIFVREESRLAPKVLERLTDEEQRVLDLVDGRTPLDAILESAEMPSYDVQSLIYRLLTLQLVRVRTRPVILE